MNESFLRLYQDELSHVRGVAADFATQYPQVAGRLGISRDICEDPFVERMIEGFAFLAARVRAKLDAEYSHFCEGLMETVYPQLLGPLPSMAIVEFGTSDKVPDPILIPRATPLHSQLRVANDTRIGETPALGAGKPLNSHLSPDHDTRCEFRTAHDVILRPVRIIPGQVKYDHRTLDAHSLPGSIAPRAVIKLRFSHVQKGKAIGTIASFDDLTLHIAGRMDEAGALFEELSTHCTGVFFRTVSEAPKPSDGRLALLDGEALQLSAPGFDVHCSLLPDAATSFDGYRLIREYGALPERYLFLKLSGSAFSEFTSQCDQDTFDLYFLLDRAVPKLTKLVEAGPFRLHVTPIINLFTCRADPIRLSERFDKAHVMVDRTHPLDFEVFQILSVSGHGDQIDRPLEFLPFYRCAGDSGRGNYFTVRRESRQPTRQELLHGAVPDYTGSETYLELVDADRLVLEAKITDLRVSALCTNRHLPISIPINQYDSDFVVTGLPDTRAKCIVPPTRPLESPSESSLVWRLLGQLSVNYLSLVESEKGAEALRNILRLYTADFRDEDVQWTRAVVSIDSEAAYRLHADPGPVAYIRGLKITVKLDGTRLAGHSAYVLGALLSRFLSSYVSVNSFVDTVVEVSSGGAGGTGSVWRWNGREGICGII